MPTQSTHELGRYLPSYAREKARELRLALGARTVRNSITDSEIDIFHETAMFPTVTDLRVPLVLTIHDMSVLRYPQYHPPDRVRFFERYFYRRMGEIGGVLTVSEFSRNEIIDLLGLDARQVTVTPLAPHRVFRPRSKTLVQTFLKEAKLPSNYLLYVGALEPRKNLRTLLRALSQTRSAVKLVRAGSEGWLNEGYYEDINRLKLSNRIIDIGHVPDDKLALLYAGAKALVYPSVYEGFGLPILEAMAVGCPAICAERPGISEVAGDSALRVEAEDDAALARNLDFVVASEEVREKLRQNGLQHAKRFSWHDTAQKTINAMRKVVGQEAITKERSNVSPDRNRFRYVDG